MNSIRKISTLLIPILFLLQGCNSGEGWQTDRASEGLSEEVSMVEQDFYIFLQGRQVLLSGETRKFNEQGFKTEETRRGRDGNVVSVTYYQTDDSGRPKAAESQGPDGKTVLKLEFAYNEEDKTQAVKYLDPNGNLSTQVVVQYDDQWNGIEEATYDKDGNMIHKVVNTYDEKGNRIKQVTYEENGAIENETTYTYNDKGLETGAKIDDVMGGEYENTFAYTFDDKGNWTQKQTMLKGDIVELRTRKLTY